MRSLPFNCLVAILLTLLPAARAVAQPASLPRFELQENEHIVVVGNTFAERVALSGYFDALVHAAHPDHQLVIRSLPWSADEVMVSPREHSVPTTDGLLEKYQADVIVMCFGMSESMAGPDGLAEFEKRLVEQIEKYHGRQFNGESAPRLVLVSPIAHEDLGPPMMTGRVIDDRNAIIGQYVETMRRVATAQNVRFVDLFQASSSSYRADSAALTNNGIHPNERGSFHFARAIGEQLGWMVDTGGTGDATRLREIAYDKYYHHRMFYRPTNTEYVFGRRHEPYGIVNFPAEREQLERMIDARERAMWAMDLPTPTALFATAPPPDGPAIWETIPTSHDFPEDEWTPAPVEAKGRENSLGSLDILPTDQFVKTFTVPEGYVIECFASEEDFEDLQNPLAMTFDARGRLWVLCTPTYPHLLPGEQPRCQLLILEDTDGDGRADQRTVFADKLYIPTGFAIDTDAVYIGQAPDLWKFTDTDGDDRADRREIVASGFGMPDSHHQISAFEWDPNGGILFHEGVFTKSNVETPYGTQRTRDAAVWRFDPRTQQIQVMSHCGFSNPWGHAYDDYGQSVLADASGGDNHSFSHVIMPFDYPRKPSRVAKFLNRGRPTAGCELIASRHFPDDVQDSFLVNQSIGFHGTRWDRTFPEGSAWRAEAMPQDLVQSSDTNFRPVGMEIGPDGALYIVDWCNPLIGHMQYSVRDPRRDHTHGRIWRVRHAERPLVTPPVIEGETVLALLELLKLPERNTRQLARRRLQTMPPADVFPVMAKWMAEMDPTDPLYDRIQLEALWIHQAQGRVDLDLLNRVASLDEPRARAGAVRVLRHWLQQGRVDPDYALATLEQAVHDDDMRVRLEGVLASGFYPGVEGASVAAVAAEWDMDEGLRIALQETLVHLSKYGEPQSEIARRLRLERIPAEELVAADMDALAAEVLLLRPDVPRENRSAALAYLSDGVSTARAGLLVAALLEARRTDIAVSAIAPLLLELSPEDLAAVEDALVEAASHEDRGVRALAVAALLRVDASHASLLQGRATLTTEVLAYLEPGEAPADALTELKRAVEVGLVEPTATVLQVARHTGDTDELFNWLEARVQAVDDRGFDKFDQNHGIAMAALRAMNQVPAAEWPAAADDRYRIAPIDSDQFEAGRAVYHDEIIGCVRCHAEDGSGMEGFPPLDGSAWVLGNPERAAAVVVHGLYGEIRIPDGHTFDAVMDPLGAILDNAQIAAVLTYVRQSWGNYAGPVTTDDVVLARAVKREDGAPLFVDDLNNRYPISRDRIVAVAAVTQTTDDAAGNAMIRILIFTFIGLGAIIAIVVVASRVKSKS